MHAVNHDFFWGAGMWSWPRGLRTVLRYFLTFRKHWKKLRFILRGHAAYALKASGPEKH